MQTSEITANPNNASPSLDSANSTTSAPSGLTVSELQLISLWRKAARSGSASQETAELLQWVFMDWVASLRRNIYDLQTMLTLFGQSSTRHSRARVTSELGQLRGDLRIVLDTWADIQYFADQGSNEADPSPESTKS